MKENCFEHLQCTIIAEMENIMEKERRESERGKEKRDSDRRKKEREGGGKRERETINNQKSQPYIPKITGYKHTENDHATSRYIRRIDVRTNQSNTCASHKP